MLQYHQQREFERKAAMAKRRQEIQAANEIAAKKARGGPEAENGPE
jgi:hypothetical protein